MRSVYCRSLSFSTLSPLWILLLVRLGDYIVNLSVFYFFNLIGKLTVFLKSQDFNMYILHSNSGLFHYHHSVFSSFVNISFINLVSIFRCSSPSHNPVYPRGVDPSVLAFSLSSHL
jgi:hypothetical protein